jgi:serine kinase of HPr protein (carbohydrate metabolism regulator)
MTLLTEELPVNLYATGLAINGSGVAIIGASGSGKSDLALRLIDRGAELICDDRIEIADIDGRAWICAVPAIAGKIEVRGLGIIDMPHLAKAPLYMLVDLDQLPERHPNPWPMQKIAGFDCPKLRLAASEASAPIKVERALQWLLDKRMKPVRLYPPPV